MGRVRLRSSRRARNRNYSQFPSRSHLRFPLCCRAWHRLSCTSCLLRPRLARSYTCARHLPLILHIHRHSRGFSTKGQRLPARPNSILRSGGQYLLPRACHSLLARISPQDRPSPHNGPFADVGSHTSILYSMKTQALKRPQGRYFLVCIHNPTNRSSSSDLKAHCNDNQISVCMTMYRKLGLSCIDVTFSRPRPGPSLKQAFVPNFLNSNRYIASQWL